MREELRIQDEANDILTRQADEKSAIDFVHWSKDPLIPYAGCICCSCESARRTWRCAKCDETSGLDEAKCCSCGAERGSLETDARRDAYGAELTPISESDGAVYAAATRSQGFVCKCGQVILYGRRHINCPAENGTERRE